MRPRSSNRISSKITIVISGKRYGGFSFSIRGIIGETSIEKENKCDEMVSWKFGMEWIRKMAMELGNNGNGNGNGF